MLPEKNVTTLFNFSPPLPPKKLDIVKVSTVGTK